MFHVGSFYKSVWTMEYSSLCLVYRLTHRTFFFFFEKIMFMQGRRCIIGGVGESNEIEFVVIWKQRKVYVGWHVDQKGFGYSSQRIHPKV